MHTTPVSLLDRLHTPEEAEAWDRFVNLCTPLLFSWARGVGLQPADARRPASAQEVAERLRELSRDTVRSEPRASASAVRPVTAPVARGPRRGLWVAAAVLVLGLLAFGWFYGGTIIRIATNERELVIETNDLNIEVTIHDGQARIHDRVKDRRFTLKAGKDHTLTVSEEGPDGLRLAAKTFRLNRGGKEIVNARMELAKVVAKPKVVPAKPGDTGVAQLTDRAAAEWVFHLGGNVVVVSGQGQQSADSLNNLSDDALPLVDRGDVRQLRTHCQALLTSLDQLKAPLPGPAREALDRLLAGQDNEPADLVALQKVLDPHCLVGVTINPESRVKAARGPASAVLTQGKRGVFLVKMHNDAGVTQPLGLEGPQLRTARTDRSGERWLWAAFHREPPLALKLSGREVEYLILICETSEVGKREAKLLFDVGQGTQDLGFRAEVPVLFTIKAK